VTTLLSFGVAESPPVLWTVRAEFGVVVSALNSVVQFVGGSPVFKGVNFGVIGQFGPSTSPGYTAGSRQTIAKFLPVPTPDSQLFTVFSVWAPGVFAYNLTADQWMYLGGSGMKGNPTFGPCHTVLRSRVSSHDM
jgi:hypothetical protein